MRSVELKRTRARSRDQVVSPLARSRLSRSLLIRFVARAVSTFTFSSYTTFTSSPATNSKHREAKCCSERSPGHCKTHAHVSACIYLYLQRYVNTFLCPWNGQPTGIRAHNSPYVSNNIQILHFVFFFFFNYSSFNLLFFLSHNRSTHIDFSSPIFLSSRSLSFSFRLLCEISLFKDYNTISQVLFRNCCLLVKNRDKTNEFQFTFYSCMYFFPHLLSAVSLSQFLSVQVSSM